MATAALNHITLEEYLALEQHAEFRSEYLNGRVIAMTGASLEHASIVLNIGVALRVRLVPRQCQVFLNDVRTRVAADSGYVYPDIVVVCGRPQLVDPQPPSLTNPDLVIEVLSKSTEAYDRGEKFAAYKQIGSLKEYVLVDSHGVRVDRFARQGDFWVHSAAADLDDSVVFASLGCALPLRDIYANVEFPPEG